MKVTKVHTYIFENGVRVEFYPISDVPGCTHKVHLLCLVDGHEFWRIAQDWFTPTAAYGVPSIKAARFYYDKHISPHDVRGHHLTLIPAGMARCCCCKWSRLAGIRAAIEQEFAVHIKEVTGGNDAVSK